MYVIRYGRARVGYLLDVLFTVVSRVLFLVVSLVLLCLVPLSVLSSVLVRKPSGNIYEFRAPYIAGSLFRMHPM